ASFPWQRQIAAPPLNRFRQTFVETPLRAPAYLVAQPVDVRYHSCGVADRRCYDPELKFGSWCSDRVGNPLDHCTHRDLITRPDIHDSFDVPIENRREGRRDVVDVKVVANLQSMSASSVIAAQERADN